MTDDYKHLNGLGLTEEECKILALLKRKRDAEDKKYKMKFSDSKESKNK